MINQKDQLRLVFLFCVKRDDNRVWSKKCEERSRSMISAYYDWTFEQVFNVVGDTDENVTLDCEHCTAANMEKVVRWLQNAGYVAEISPDWERIYVSRKGTRGVER